MLDAMAAFKAYFQALEVGVVAVDEDTLTVPVRISTGFNQGIVSVRPAQSIVVFYVASPVRVPPERRLAVAEYLTRANYGLVMGNFEMDMNDGEVRFRVSLDYEALAELPPKQIENVVQPAIFLTDLYLPGLQAVVSEGADPAEALARVEK